jgi:ribosomal-protein-alanine N-acetyltransferase
MEISPPVVLETRRLMLRRARPEDAPAIFEYANDPEVTRMMNWLTHTEVSQASDFIEAAEKGWTDGTEFTWLITIKSDSLPIGAISCFPDRHSAEIGFVFNRQCWGRGHATEAAHRVMEWLFDGGAVRRVWATCDVDNLASARVLEKIGMTREGKLSPTSFCGRLEKLDSRIAPFHQTRPRCSEPKPRTRILLRRRANDIHHPPPIALA